MVPGRALARAGARMERKKGNSMDAMCPNGLAWSLLLESIAPPPEADEFMAELCRDETRAGDHLPRFVPEAIVDGT
jgi:hypothetical protein